MLASSRNLAAAEGPKRRAKTPALHCGREREVIRKRQLFARPVGGPMQASAPAQGAGCRSRRRCTYTLYCRAGVHARRGDRGRPGRVLAGQGAAPLSRRAPTAPLTGAPSRRLPKASPARGGGCAVRRRRRGALPACGGDILQNSAGHCPASVGDDADIAPETLRRRKAPNGGRKRPPYIAAGSGRRQIRASHPPGPSAGRCKHRPLRRGRAAAVSPPLRRYAAVKSLALLRF